MFDQTPAQVALAEPLLSPAVAYLEPRERLERLRQWLLTPEAEKGWDYCIVISICGTVGCAWGQYRAIVIGDCRERQGLMENDTVKEFGISPNQSHAIFRAAGDGKHMSDVRPVDVATVIGMVQRGEIR